MGRVRIANERDRDRAVRVAVLAVTGASIPARERPAPVGESGSSSRRREGERRGEISRQRDRRSGDSGAGRATADGVGPRTGPEAARPTGATDRPRAASKGSRRAAATPRTEDRSEWRSLDRSTSTSIAAAAATSRSPLHRRPSIRGRRSARPWQPGRRRADDPGAPAGRDGTAPPRRASDDREDDRDDYQPESRRRDRGSHRPSSVVGNPSTTGPRMRIGQCQRYSE